MEKDNLINKAETGLLSQIDSPADLKKLLVKDLPRLAEEIREVIIDTVCKTGGHCASNLGSVELTIALHYVFDAPKDKIIWDVGHQSYAHKLLTGRREKFHTLRQHGGISGFPRRSEGPYDFFDVGHSGTSISAALGMAEAQKRRKESNDIIAVIGDGSINTGLAFEGLNQTGDLKSKIIVVLNDNEMSISPNVGALAAYLSRIITGKAYNRLHTELMDFLKTIPSIGPTLCRVVKQAEESFKGFIVPGLLFEELGFKYAGPIQGHNLQRLIENLRNESGVCHTAKDAPPSYTDIFSEALIELAQEDDRIIAITAGMTTGTGLTKFKEVFPDRFYDVGIAEQHAVTFAGGLAAEGLRPVVAIYSTFLQRAYDQIVHDVCLQNQPVVFAIDRGGIVGEDGSTHHGLFDLSYLRHLPNMVIMAPKDENELRNMLCTCFALQGPAAIRYPRGKIEGVAVDTTMKVLPIGKAEILSQGSDVLIFAIGNSVSPALSAAALLKEEGIGATVVNGRFIKPLDETLICELAQKIGKILTVEENVLAGGFGSALLETLEQHSITGVQVKRIGIADRFVEHGAQKILRKNYGLDDAGIFQAVLSLLAFQNSNQAHTNIAARAR